jgi:hypothetical protein
VMMWSSSTRPTPQVDAVPLKLTSLRVAHLS